MISLNFVEKFASILPGALLKLASSQMLKEKS